MLAISSRMMIHRSTLQRVPEAHETAMTSKNDSSDLILKARNAGGEYQVDLPTLSLVTRTK